MNSFALTPQKSESLTETVDLFAEKCDEYRHQVTEEDAQRARLVAEFEALAVQVQKNITSIGVWL